MTIQPVVTVTTIQGGVSATAIEIGLAGHGRTPDKALTALRSMVGTWARLLAADGELERVLARRGIASRDDTDTIAVDLLVDSVTA
jgi:hypothetical protein